MFPIPSLSSLPSSFLHSSSPSPFLFLSIFLPPFSLFSPLPSFSLSGHGRHPRRTWLSVRTHSLSSGFVKKNHIAELLSIFTETVSTTRDDEDKLPGKPTKRTSNVLSTSSASSRRSLLSPNTPTLSPFFKREFSLLYPFLLRLPLSCGRSSVTLL